MATAARLAANGDGPVSDSIEAMRITRVETRVTRRLDSALHAALTRLVPTLMKGSGADFPGHGVAQVNFHVVRVAVPVAKKRNYEIET